MYSIIEERTKIIIFSGTDREYRSEGGRGELLMICKTKLEVKQKTRKMNKPIDCPFPLHLTRQDMFRLGLIDKPFDEKTLRKMSEAKLGNKNPNYGGLKESTKQKMSAVRKGKSGFQGKKHRLESKLKTSQSMKGKRNLLGWIWCHNGLDEERRVKVIPPGWYRGRIPGFMKSIRKQR